MMPAYHILLNTTIISTTWTFYVPCNLWFCPLSCMAWGQESIWLGMRKNLLNPRTRRRVNKENILDPSTTFTTPNPCMCIKCIYIPCNIDENIVCLLTSRVIEMYFLFLYQDICISLSVSPPRLLHKLSEDFTCQGFSSSHLGFKTCRWKIYSTCIHECGPFL